MSVIRITVPLEEAEHERLLRRARGNKRSVGMEAAFLIVVGMGPQGTQGGLRDHEEAEWQSTAKTT